MSDSAIYNGHEVAVESILADTVASAVSSISEPGPLFAPSPSATLLRPKLRANSSILRRARNAVRSVGAFRGLRRG